jgi:cation diffusion facilitator CzcD-associated flavoprotein CzcO
MAEPHRLDALVVGLGFGGLYELYLLKQLGLNVKAIDSAADVGGTWW